MRLGLVGPTPLGLGLDMYLVGIAALSLILVPLMPLKLVVVAGLAEK
jgi:hypothetical protein